MQITCDQCVRIKKDEGLALGQDRERFNLVAIGLVFSGVFVLNWRNLSAQSLNQGANVRIGDGRVLCPTLIMLRLCDEDLAIKIWCGLA